ncbi:hypothetical protein ACRALDRAFT_1076785 [Sodiomyces alcalophilus JCM 7366]|uniref:uncharacterized protein n=1 Tax=Sodiomyces alcalophilus JCM 7366 TaxID=591952 RepID=UPI0039B50DC9
MSQVKNLRAMFEQKNDSSPPDNSVGTDRGRSPAGSATGGTDTPTPRPLSKVRSNFIAIEKDGRVGLRRDPSNDSARSQSQRRLSSNTEEGSVSAHSEKANMAPETIPESPRQLESNPPAPAASVTNGHDAPKLGAVTDKPGLNPDKHVDTKTPNPTLRPASSADKPPSKPLAPIGESGANAAKTTRLNKTAPRAANKQPAKPQTTATKPPGKAAARTPTSVAKSTSGTHAAKTTREPVKKSTEKPTATTKTTTGTTGARSTFTRSTTPASATKTGKRATPAPVQVSPGSGTGFVKPKVKSPTRPVNLPSSLMAPTAASSSKVREGGRDSLPGSGRSLSRASASTVSTSTPNKTIRRQRSTISHLRPSVGPPPKKSHADHPVTHKDREVDESFLARMMRPTQSSNSKVTDKVPVTPPRRGNTRNTPGSARGTTSASASGKKMAAKSAQPVTGSPGPKSARPAAAAPKVTASAKETQDDVAPSVVAEAELRDVAKAVQSLDLGANNKKDESEAKPTPHSTAESEQAPEPATEVTVEETEEPVAEPAPVEEPEVTKNDATEADVAESATPETQDTSRPEQDGDGTKSEVALADELSAEAASCQIVEENTASGEAKPGSTEATSEETVPAAAEGETKASTAEEDVTTGGDAAVDTDVPAEESNQETTTVQSTAE